MAGQYLIYRTFVKLLQHSEILYEVPEFIDVCIVLHYQIFFEKISFGFQLHPIPPPGRTVLRSYLETLCDRYTMLWPKVHAAQAFAIPHHPFHALSWSMQSKCIIWRLYSIM